MNCDLSFINQVKILKPQWGTESLSATKGLYIATEFYGAMYRDVDKMSVRTAFGQLNRPCTVFSTCFDWDQFTRAKNTRHIQIVGPLTTQINKNCALKLNR